MSSSRSGWEKYFVAPPRNPRWPVRGWGLIIPFALLVLPAYVVRYKLGKLQSWLAGVNRRANSDAMDYFVATLRERERALYYDFKDGNQYKYFSSPREGIVHEDFLNQVKVPPQ
eukprot:TRINITY_DN315_c0_g1_i1.p1 TRINITY_DN315_c0_g1~~TRINITY_DN315_c0_g1_i1.p1  ORF type:complete len:114 (-),score=20.41 TRINITY_DN315_c0_g1_i1:49-390(-)